VINYATFRILEKNLFLFRRIIIIENVTVFVIVRTMAVIFMILNVYVIDIIPT
jgi:hypothetical protein